MSGEPGLVRCFKGSCLHPLHVNVLSRLADAACSANFVDFKSATCWVSCRAARPGVTFHRRVILTAVESAHSKCTCNCDQIGLLSKISPLDVLPTSTVRMEPKRTWNAHLKVLEGLSADVERPTALTALHSVFSLHSRDFSTDYC